MKVTFIEEIEARRAWFGNMYCPQCIYGKYDIHHQLEPEVLSSWWIQCPNCGHEGPHSPAREIAIARWQQENETSN